MIEKLLVLYAIAWFCFSYVVLDIVIFILDELSKITKPVDEK